MVYRSAQYPNQRWVAILSINLGRGDAGVYGGIISIIVDDVVADFTIVRVRQACSRFSVFPKLSADDVRDIENRRFFKAGTDEVFNIFFEVADGEVAVIRVVPLEREVNVFGLDRYQARVACSRARCSIGSVLNASRNTQPALDVIVIRASNGFAVRRPSNDVFDELDVKVNAG